MENKLFLQFPYCPPAQYECSSLTKVVCYSTIQHTVMSPAPCGVARFLSVEGVELGEGHAQLLAVEGVDVEGDRSSLEGQQRRGQGGGVGGHIDCVPVLGRQTSITVLVSEGSEEGSEDQSRPPKSRAHPVPGTLFINRKVVSHNSHTVPTYTTVLLSFTV